MSIVRRLSFLFRPGWVILALVVVAFAYLCFNVLAPWQLGKNIRTSHRNDLIAASVNATPVDVTTLLPGGSAVSGSADVEWRRVTADGSYVPGSTVLERLQRLDDKPAYGVLATFRLADGRHLLVDRGLVAAPDGSHLPQISEPPTGPQQLQARVRRSEGLIPGKEPMTQDGYRQVYSIDTGELSTVLATPITAIPAGDRGGYLQLDEKQPGAFTPESLPQLDQGPYLSYGLQWIAFGVMAPLGLAYFVRAELRERRRERAEDAAGSPPDEPATTDASTADAESAAPADAEPQHPAQSTERRLADRYGGTRR